MNHHPTRSALPTGTKRRSLSLGLLAGLLRCSFCRPRTPDAHFCLSPQSLWIERTTLILSRPLPGISRWAEVERREVVRSSGRRDHAPLRAGKALPRVHVLLLDPAECVCLQVEVSPIENAIYVVENKTQELRTLISQYQHRQHQGNINPLSMCLNGVIDAAVNGGIARYQEVTLETAWLSRLGLQPAHRCSGSTGLL